MKTMVDLRREVATRMRNALHGREVDMVEGVRPQLPHMLGVTPLHKPHDPTNEEMTLLDPSHHFWEEYEGSVETRSVVAEKIKTAIHSLREDGTVEMTFPYGEEAEIVYVEVDDITTAEKLQTSCPECSRTIQTDPDLLQYSDSFYITVSLDCESCEYETTLKTDMEQL